MEDWDTVRITATGRRGPGWRVDTLHSTRTVCWRFALVGLLLVSPENKIIGPK